MSTPNSFALKGNSCRNEKFVSRAPLLDPQCTCPPPLEVRILPTAMKTFFVASAVLLVGIVQFGAQGPIPNEPLRNVFPAGARVEQFALTGDGTRTYYTTTSGEIWLYERGKNESARIATGSVWDLAVSPLRDAV